MTRVVNWLGRQRCRWLDRHSDERFCVGQNPVRQCRFCKRHGQLTAEDIAILTGVRRGYERGDEDALAVEKTPDRAAE